MSSGSGKDDGQEHLERMMPLARGPQGEPGEPGKRGERGLSRIQGRAVVVLFLIAVAFGVFNLFWTGHSVTGEQAKWCGLVVTLDKADAAAPKKPASGTFTSALVAEIHDLRQALGCGNEP